MLLSFPETKKPNFILGKHYFADFINYKTKNLEILNQFVYPNTANSYSS